MTQVTAAKAKRECDDISLRGETMTRRGWSEFFRLEKQQSKLANFANKEQFKAKNMLTKRAKNFAVRLAFVVASGFGLLAMSPETAEAGLVFSLADIENNRQLAANPAYQWAAAIKGVNQTGIPAYASAIAIAPDVYINAGHFTPSNGSQTSFHLELVFGRNYNTSTSRYEVDRTQRFPGYVVGNTSTIDLGVGWTKNFIQGFDTPVIFGTVPISQNGTMVDYGNIAGIGTMEIPSQGDRLAGVSERIEDFTNVYPESLYDFFRFNTSNPLSTRGLNYSSGSPWYNPNFELGSLSIAGTEGTFGGITVGLDLNTPAVQSYLQPIIQDSWNRYFASIPEPGSFALLAAAAATTFGMRRARPARSKL